SLQGLFDKANLLVVTPSPPTLGTQHIDLHSPRDLKARLKVKSSGRLSNYTRRPTPEGYDSPSRPTTWKLRCSMNGCSSTLRRNPNSPDHVLEIDGCGERRSVGAV